MRDLILELLFDAGITLFSGGALFAVALHVYLRRTIRAERKTPDLRR
jgi:hypothetical protein